MDTDGDLVADNEEDRNAVHIACDEVDGLMVPASATIRLGRIRRKHRIPDLLGLLGWGVLVLMGLPEPWIQCVSGLVDLRWTR